MIMLHSTTKETLQLIFKVVARILLQMNQLKVAIPFPSLFACILTVGFLRRESARKTGLRFVLS